MNGLRGGIRAPGAGAAQLVRRCLSALGVFEGASLAGVAFSRYLGRQAPQAGSPGPGKGLLFSGSPGAASCRSYCESGLNR